MAADDRPDIGDVIVYVGDERTGTLPPDDVWRQRRDEATEYLVIDTAYDDPDGNSELCAMLHGNRDPKGRWPLNEWITVEPERVRIVRKAHYEAR